METVTALVPTAPGAPSRLTICKDPNATTAPLPSPGIAIELCSDSKADTANGHNGNCPPPLSLDQRHDLHRNLTSPVITTSGWQSPARHHRRTPSQHREIKETIDARTEYTNDDIDGHSQHRINQYRIIEEIGRGSYGAVHRAVDQYGTEFAVKEFSKARLRRRAQSLVMRRPPGPVFRRPIRRAVTSFEEPNDSLHFIRQEIAIMKKLHHDNLVELIEVLDDPEEDSLYMVLELCNKGPVMKIEVGQRATPLDYGKARCCFRDLLLGIEYLHAQNICHRDIKPDNLLMTQDDVLKIVDFGVSQMFAKSGEMKTAKSAGSPAFMPPELCCKHAEVSGPAADIWSMGVCLYCFKYGRLPFDRDNALDIYKSIANDPLVIPADEDPVFADLMHRILEKDPEKRITMVELREHAWVTNGGTDPLLPAEENRTDMIEMPNPLELNHAFTRKMSHIICVVKAINKFLALRDKNREARRASRRLSSSENKRQDSTVEEAEALVQARQQFLLAAQTNISPGDGKRPSAPTSPSENKNFFLGVGTGGRDEFGNETIPRDIVSDSPIGADFNIYDKAFGAQVDNNNNMMPQEEERGSEASAFMTGLVHSKDQFQPNGVGDGVSG